MPKESESWTEMSYFLVQLEAGRLLHPVLGTRSSNTLADIAAKRQMLQEHTEWIYRRYPLINNASSDSLLRDIVVQHYDTAYAKMNFMLQLREEIYLRQQESSASEQPHEASKPSFKSACHALEASYLLLSKDFSKQFAWLFKTYTQYYALAYVLRCLWAWPRVREADNAWAAVHNIFSCVSQFNRHTETSSTGPGDRSIWRCLVILRDQAMRARIDSEQSYINCSPSMETCSGDLPLMRNEDQGQKDGSGQGVLGFLRPHAEQPEFMPDLQNGLFSLGYSTQWLSEWDDVINGNIDAGLDIFK